MHVKTTLEYTYEPPSLFEIATTVDTPVGCLVFNAGSAVLTLVQPTKPVSRELVANATASVRLALQGRQMLARQSFTLRGPNITHHNDNGSRDIVLIAETGMLRITGHAPDILITAADGTVVRDTRVERLERDTELLTRLVSKGSTSVIARRMIESFGKSIDDPANELVHLYEIRDAAADHFGGETIARAKLKVSKAEWSQLGRLANDEPLNQGRHRGRQSELLRDAAPDELSVARRIARQIIEAFVAAT